MQRPSLGDDELELVRSIWQDAKRAAFPESSAAQHAKYDGDLPRFCTEVLGHKQWEFQKYLQRALMQHRFVMVCGPRKNSKTHTAAEIVVAMMCTGPTTVLTTSGSQRQVEYGLWQKIRAFHANARQALPGKPHGFKWEIAPEWYALGFSAGDAGTVQGFHAGVDLERDAEDTGELKLATASEALYKIERTAHRLLIVLDEAAEIDKEILERLEGSMAGKNVYVLAQCNPTFDENSDHPTARWWRRGSSWHRIHVAGEELPNPNWEPHAADKCFHGIPEEIQPADWRRAMVKSHGIDSAFTRVFVYGLPATVDLDRALIPRALLESCADLPQEGEDRHIGVDIGGGGSDPSVAYLWIGNTIAARHEWRSPDTMATVGVILELMSAWGDASGPVPAAHVHVDATGLGKGVADRLKQTGHQVDAVDFGASPRYGWKQLTGQTLFRNMRGEMHWTLRRLLEEQRAAIPRKYSELWRQACWYSYNFREAARGSMAELGESKDEIRERYGRSPDDLDACILGLARKSASRPTIRVMRI
jgi:hypothetical protein